METVGAYENQKLANTDVPGSLTFVKYLFCDASQMHYTAKQYQYIVQVHLWHIRNWKPSGITLSVKRIFDASQITYIA